MKTILLGFITIAFLGIGTPVFAQDSECQQLSDDVWGCPIPTKPPGPPTCHIFGASLICSAPVATSPLPEKRAPTNCGWRKGRYICW